MPKIEFTADFDWYFDSGCCGFAVQAFKAGWSGDVVDSVADAAVLAGRARLVELDTDDGEAPEV